MPPPAPVILSDVDPAAVAPDLPDPEDPIRLIKAENDTGEKAIAKALGEELRRAREERGWSRAQFVERLPSGIGERTLLAYEHGSRQLTVARLVELCEALGSVGPEVLTLALQRAGLQLQNLDLQIDLTKMLDNMNHKFRPMHQWARNKLNETPSRVAELSPAAVRELANFVGQTHRELADYLATFTPDKGENP